MSGAAALAFSWDRRCSRLFFEAKRGCDTERLIQFLKNLKEMRGPKSLGWTACARGPRDEGIAANATDLAHRALGPGRPAPKVARERGTLRAWTDAPWVALGRFGRRWGDGPTGWPCRVYP